MKNLTKYLKYGLAAVLVTGCDTKELHDLNINPQALNEVNLNLLFTSVELGLASNGTTGDNRYIDWRTNIGWCGYAIQQLASSGGGISPGDKYTVNAETNAAPFEFIYNDQLKNLAEILKQSGPGGFAEGKYVNLRQISRIIRAFSYARLADYYGNIPYSEANKGTDGIFFPKYDTQEFVYTDVLKELDEATSALNASNGDEGLAAADFIYKGDLAKWKKFGFSVMLRLAMRISNVDAAKAATYVTKAAAGGVFTSNADNMWVQMADGPSEWVNQNGISRAFDPGDGGQPSYLSATLVDFLKGTNKNAVADDDPRLMIISGGIGDWTTAGFTPITVDPLKQKGMPNGYDLAMLAELEKNDKLEVGKTYSRINVKMLQDSDPYMIMNYGEVELLLAEALERKIGTGIAGTAKSHYEAGVKASMQMYTPYDASLTVSDAAVTTYLTTYQYGGTKPALEMIGEQLWVNKFFNWWEAWSDWRRTGYPKLTPTNYPGNVTGGTIPVRLRYPTNEVAGNPNYQTGATLPDDFTTKVWWDK
ncbi:SusD/RagB family nutrient-binding outer membrane lipoprotein [Dyadobacter sandarakinus]|uniref:SusD/RagB family nutrient-binding outer membrane lipoprotein n=1 Tax=Dyadobacter sandarakinus TaxID=2747268 RepID=A0ABX7IBV5_9BACT|nr:SusD/RagB family nutrient-binding outer membrane lipoprotein [Dyadobacter sandarakinus]QRR03308.1 SusD/RagB family nutrient-binding outer membrane lipoprotein [Dyadobacter sandarakinus]